VVKSGVPVPLDLAAAFDKFAAKFGDRFGPIVELGQERGDPIANVRRLQKRRELLPAD
jgi:hypothetical protein